MSKRYDMSSALLVLALVLWVATTVHAQDDRADWVDPNDMLNFDLTTGEMRKQPVKEEEIKVCELYD